VALLLVGIIAALAPAVYADPPDPTWLGGYWDNGDFDDVVILLDGTAAIVQPFTAAAAPPCAVVAVLECLEPLGAPTAVDETASPRAPPPTVCAS